MILQGCRINKAVCGAERLGKCACGFCCRRVKNTAKRDDAIGISLRRDWTLDSHISKLLSSSQTASRS